MYQVKWQVSVHHANKDIYYKMLIYLNSIKQASDSGFSIKLLVAATHLCLQNSGLTHTLDKRVHPLIKSALQDMHNFIHTSQCQVPW